MCTKGLLPDTLLQVLDETSRVTSASKWSNDSCRCGPQVWAGTRPDANLDVVMFVALVYLS